MNCLKDTHQRKMTPKSLVAIEVDMHKKSMDLQEVKRIPVPLIKKSPDGCNAILRMLCVSLLEQS